MTFVFFEDFPNKDFNISFKYHSMLLMLLPSVNSWLGGNFYVHLFPIILGRGGVLGQGKGSCISVC